MKEPKRDRLPTVAEGYEMPDENDEGRDLEYRAAEEIVTDSLPGDSEEVIARIIRRHMKPLREYVSRLEVAFESACGDRFCTTGQACHRDGCRELKKLRKEKP